MEVFAHDAPSYGAAMVGVATAKTPCGPFTYKGSWKPLGADSRDEGLFQDGTYCIVTIASCHQSNERLSSYR